MEDTIRDVAIAEFVRKCAESFKSDGGLCLSEPEVTVLLLNTAIILGLPAMQEEAADAFWPTAYCWWDLSNALSRGARVALHNALREVEIPFPPHPGDIIERRD